MATKKSAKKSPKNAKTHTKTAPAKKPKFPRNVWFAVKNWFTKLTRKNRDFKKRRPHRTFRRTRQRDYRRSLKLPGYIAFTNQVWQMLWRNRKMFLKLFILYALLSALIVGVLSQADYSSLRDTLNSTDEDLGFGKWLALITGAATGSASASSNETQQIFSAVLLLMGWLTIVWLLRQIMVGNRVKLRDGLYSSGSPILATVVVALVMVLQMLPFAIAMLAYSALTGAGIINVNVAIENMAAWFALAVIGVLTLYWLTSSFIALVIVTLPGMYPFRALKAAGDMVVGRRLRILLRLIWMIVPMAILWALILVPAVLADDKWQISWLPLVPIAMLLLSTATLMWIATYIYMLYRKVVDDDAKPALQS